MIDNEEWLGQKYSFFLFFQKNIIQSLLRESIVALLCHWYISCRHYRYTLN